MAGWSTAQLIFVVQRAMTLQFRPEEQNTVGQLPS
jgi:hypothetical protein